MRLYKSVLKFYFLLIIGNLCFLTIACAETVILKSGQEIKGRILEKTDKYIKIYFQEMPLTYYLDEIESIDGKKLNEYSQEFISGRESKNTEEAKYIQNPVGSVDTSFQKQEEQNIKNMLHTFFGYECNFVYDEANADKPAGRIINHEIENARLLIDWDNYEVEPKSGFQLVYKMAVNDLMKTITQRNVLTAKFNSIKMTFKQAGLTQRIEDYKIKEIDMNDALGDATVIYTNATGEKKLKVHKKDGNWLIYRDFTQ